MDDKPYTTQEAWKSHHPECACVTCEEKRNGSASEALKEKLHKARCDRHVLYGFAEIVANLKMGEGISAAGLGWLIENAQTAIERAQENE